MSNKLKIAKTISILSNKPIAFKTNYKLDNHAKHKINSIVKEYEDKLITKILDSTEKKKHLDEQYKLSRCYTMGIGVEQNYGKAFELCHDIAKFGCRPAQVQLGDHYSTGTGVEQDIRNAFDWYLIAAEQEDPYAQMKIAECYLKGTSVVEQDNEKAFEWYNRAADNGYPEAMFKVSEMYDEGIGVKQNKDKSEHMYDKAVTQNDYIKVKQDKEVEQYEDALKRDKEKREKLAKTDDGTKRFNILYVLAMDGDTYARDKVLRMSKNRWEWSYNLESYYYWLFVMAEDGHFNYQDELYKLCQYKIETDSNIDFPIKGTKWTQDYIKNLELNEKYYRLAKVYHDNIIVSRDDIKSLKWYKKGAEKLRDERCIKEIINCFECEIGVEYDEKSIREWTEKLKGSKFFRD